MSNMSLRGGGGLGFGRSRSGSCSSLTRLPDEAPNMQLTPSASGGNTPTSVRPNSGSGSRKHGGMLRLTDEVLTPATATGNISGNPFCLPLGPSTPTKATPPSPQRPGSSSSQKSNSMLRLPDESTAPAAPTLLLLPIPAAAARSIDDSAGTAPSGQPTGTAIAPKSRMRDRMSKNLQIATNVRTPTAKVGPQIFRRLNDGEKITDMYNFKEEIYSGGAKGKVVVATRKSDGAEVVVKVRTRQSNRTSERTWRAIMSQVTNLGSSPHVLDIMEIFEGEDEFYVIMPKCNGGELFEFLANETEVPEAECKRIMRELLVAVGHLHKNNIVHRDIKPENIMFDRDNSVEASPKTVKLIDFDTCMEWSPVTPKSRRFVGTPGYIAPEALMGQISPQSDIWSVGVILYILMTGEMPWSTVVTLEDGVVGSPSAKQMYNSLKAEVLDWKQDPWPDFPLACDLCQKLLAFNTDERLQSVEEALAHEWLKEVL